MKRFTWLLLGLAVVVLAASPILAAQKADKGKKAKGGSDTLRGEYAIMVSRCELSDQQKTDLQAKVKARKEAQAAWQQANGEKQKALREARKKAKEAGDKDAMKKARDDLKALDAGRRKIDADTMAAIYAVLTPEQKAKWKAFQTYRRLMRRYKRVGLKKDQQAKIRELAAGAGGDLAGLRSEDNDTRKKAREADKKLRTTIEQQVLTAEQREALQKKPEKKPRPEKKPAKEKAEK